MQLESKVFHVQFNNGLLSKIVLNKIWMGLVKKLGIGNVRLRLGFLSQSVVIYSF